MNYVFHSREGGYYHASRQGLHAHAFRWHESHPSDVYAVTTRKEATDEGRPAELVRTFDAVCDDFGTLVEVVA